METAEKNKRRQLVFENGRVFRGIGFGSGTESAAEVVFNTSMTGYQEIMSDPNCSRQIVLMTYPLIGSCGLADEDYESKLPSAGGLAVRDYNDSPSNYRYTKTLSEEMEERGIPGISGIDTREITRMLRSEGLMWAAICDDGLSLPEAQKRILAAKEVRRQGVGCKKIWYSRTPNRRWDIVAVDCGIRQGVVRSLNLRGCNVIVVPANTSPERVAALRPDGLLFSDGPGDPADADGAVRLVSAMQGSLPIFGIGLGHQIIALANDADIVRMPVGHHGGNYPVINLITGRIEITAQNHRFAVDGKSAAEHGMTVTHRNLVDGTVEGLENAAKRISSVQYNPESLPGSGDGAYLYDSFTALIERCRKGEL